MATPAQTLGESLAHVTRTERWAMAVFAQLFCSVGMTSSLIYGCTHSSLSVPWRLPLVLSYGAYMSVLFLIESYAELLLPRTPVTVIEKLRLIGGWGVGIGVLGLMLSAVLGATVEDSRVLSACTCLVAVAIAGLVVFWVLLARMYRSLESSTVPAATAQLPRVPI